MGTKDENLTVPKRMFEDLKVKTISCGHQHSAILTEKGDVYTTG